MALQTVLSAETWGLVEHAMQQNLNQHPSKFVKDVPTKKLALAHAMVSLGKSHSHYREHLTFAR